MEFGSEIRRNTRNKMSVKGLNLHRNDVGEEDWTVGLERTILPEYFSVIRMFLTVNNRTLN